MERLSEKSKWAIEECVDSWSQLQEEAIKKAIDRLAAYEDTGLEPSDLALGINAAIRKKLACEYFGLTSEQTDKLEEFVEADEEGRLVVLPAKVGDTVYFRTYAKNATVDLGIQPHEVVATKAYVVVKGEYTDVGLSAQHFGKTWFLTREEAEAELRGGKEDEDRINRRRRT